MPQDGLTKEHDVAAAKTTLAAAAVAVAVAGGGGTLPWLGVRWMAGSEDAGRSTLGWRIGYAAQQEEHRARRTLQNGRTLGSVGAGSGSGLASTRCAASFCLRCEPG